MRPGERLSSAFTYKDGVALRVREWDGGCGKCGKKEKS